MKKSLITRNIIWTLILVLCTGAFSLLCINLGKNLFSYDVTALTGTGTATDPYLIYSAEDFKEFGRIANNSYGKLMNDIDMQRTGLGVDGLKITEFDGNGHTISNAEWNEYVTKAVKTTKANTYSLFTRISSSTTIKNLRVFNCGRQNDNGISGEYKSNSKAVGGIVGWSQGGTIKNCIVENFIVKTKDDTGMISVGGIFATGYATVENCLVKGMEVEKCNRTAGVGPCSSYVDIVTGNSIMSPITSVTNLYETKQSYISACVVVNNSVESSEHYDYSKPTYTAFNGSIMTKEVDYGHQIYDSFVDSDKEIGKNTQFASIASVKGGPKNENLSKDWYYSGDYNDGWPMLRYFIKNWDEIQFNINPEGIAESLESIFIPSDAKDIYYVDANDSKNIFIHNQNIAAKDIEGYNFIGWEHKDRLVYTALYEPIIYTLTFSSTTGTINVTSNKESIEVRYGSTISYTIDKATNTYTYVIHHLDNSTEEIVYQFPALTEFQIVDFKITQNQKITSDLIVSPQVDYKTYSGIFGEKS